MAYKIQYSPEAACRYPQEREKRKPQLGKWLGLALIVAAALWVRVNGVPDFLIPGNPEITKAATVALIGDIQEGAPWNEAVTVFCETIIDGAEN